MISPQAIIDPTVELGENVEIGPFSLIGKDVKIGDNTKIASNVVIKGPTTIGKACQVFQFASLGEAPQDIHYDNEPTGLEIGDKNIFRECTTIHRGTVAGQGKTKIGESNLFMAYTHVAHDCQVGDHVIFSNNASLSGHVVVGDYATLGGMVGVRQFCLIGEHSFLAGGATVFKDVLPFTTVFGYPAQAHGLNIVGLERRGYPSNTISLLRTAYKIIYRKGNTVSDAIAQLKEIAGSFSEINLLINCLSKSKRGIVR